MIANRKTVLDAAMELSLGDRAEVARQLFDSLPHEHDVLAEMDPDVRAAWTSELKKRVEEIDRGETELIPGDQVMQELREKFDS